MSWSQTFVVSWVQFVCAAALLLLCARVAMRWIIQPAERIRLIQLIIASALAVPLLMALSSRPTWRLRLLPSEHRAVAPVRPSLSHDLLVAAKSPTNVYTQEPFDRSGA